MKNKNLFTKVSIGVAASLLVSMVSLTACNKQIVDLDYKFNYAYIELPNGESIEGPVSTWNDYENSDMIQVTINGNVYYTHSSRVILVNRKGE